MKVHAFGVFSFGLIGLAASVFPLVSVTSIWFYVTIVCFLWVLVSFSILLHELAHVKAAAFQDPPARIVAGTGPKVVSGKFVSFKLFPLWGYSTVSIDSQPAFRSVLIFLAGPLANLSVAGFFYLVVVGLFDSSINLVSFPFSANYFDSVFQTSSALELVLVLVFWINFGLAVTNLVPLPPADGGNACLKIFEILVSKVLGFEWLISRRAYVFLTWFSVFLVVIFCCGVAFFS